MVSRSGPGGRAWHRQMTFATSDSSAQVESLVKEYAQEVRLGVIQYAFARLQRGQVALLLIFQMLLAVDAVKRDKQRGRGGLKAHQRRGQGDLI